MNWADLGQLLPIGVVLLTALVVVFLDLSIKTKDRYVLPMLAFSGCLVAIAALGQNYLFISADLGAPPPWFVGLDEVTNPRFNPFLLGGAFVLDGFGMGISLIALLAGALSILCSSHEADSSALKSGEYYGLVLLAVAGMMLMGYSHDFLTLLVSLEIMSIATYILAGSDREEVKSAESALKYLVLGAFSTAFMMMGIAFVFGATGSISLAPATVALSPYLLVGGLGLLLVGVLFKVGAAPFHFWVPDVYEGAPSGVTGLMAVGVKAAAFAVVARLCFYTYGNLFRADWVWLLMVAAVLTMLVGNLLAMHQTNVKRLLAYSGIAHTGYLLLAFLVQDSTSAATMSNHTQAVFFYLMAYGVMTLGAFGVVSLLREDGKRLETLEDLTGLAKTHPAVALSMSVFMFSLAGLPPFAGFFAKFMIFKSAIEVGYVVPATLGILTSIASMYYYLRVVKAMYMDTLPAPARGQEPVEPKCEYTWTGTLLIYGAGLATLAMGLMPNLVSALYR